jgi:AcrR family transcriptional regulator
MPLHCNSRARILQAALSLFSERGYEATSTREICELAGITKPTLYYFYRSKEGVYRALIEDGDRQFHELLEQALASNGTFRERCKNMVEALFENAGRHEELARFMFSMVWTPNAPFTVELHKSYDKAVHLVAQAAKAAVKAGEIAEGNIDVRTLVLMGAMMEAFSDYLAMGHPKLTRKLAHEIVDTVFDGWQPLKAKAGK